MTSIEIAKKLIETGGICASINCGDGNCPRNGSCDRVMGDSGKVSQETVEICQKFLLEHEAEEASKLPLYSEYDPVNHPNHYASSGIECIEAIKASMTEEAFRGYLKGNVQKYLWRYEKKVAPAEDLKKASWYLTRLIEEVDNGSKSN